MMTRQQMVEFLGRGPRAIHCIGIGGSGMSGLARLLTQQGHLVSGCDACANGATSGLRRLGIPVQVGHGPRHITRETELVVYTSAVNGENRELQAAQELKVPTVRRGQLLSALMNCQNNIAVAGTHGKTTTSAMIAHVLGRSDSAPGFCIGAPVPVLGGNAQMGAGKYFVAEACESDGTLAGFTPEYAVCLNIEPDHLDYHGSMEKLEETFAVFLASTLRMVFYCADCSRTAALAKRLRTAVSFGLSEGADYRALEVAPTARGVRFAVACRDQKIADIALPIPGRQNVVNALAALAVAEELGVPIDKIVAALAEFTGAKRRFERRFEGDGVVVVDDYAHHPTEIRATIAAAQSLSPGFQRVLVAFQPHRYTRTQALLDEFATAFAGADGVYLTEIYGASEKPIEGVTGQALAARVPGAVFEPDIGKLAERLFAASQPGDLILTMGAGNIDQTAEWLSERFALRGRNGNGAKRQAMNTESDLKALLSADARLRVNEPMAKHTTLRVGGPAQFWVEPHDERDLARVLHYCHVREIPVTIVGRGTNLLVRDGGIEGVVIHLGGDEFAKVEADGDRIVARAGARLKALVSAATKAEVGGLEFLEGIPGTVGGALRMNAGAMGRQTFDVLEWVRYVSLAGEIYDADAPKLPVRYRCCPVFATHVAMTAIFRGEKTPRAKIEETLRVFEKKRWSSQPAKPSAGCIFKNPLTIPAGKLIDELGLKGQRVGGAVVSDVHGNFIVTENGATAADVLALIEKIRAHARKERGIELEPEVMILGKDNGKK